MYDQARFETPENVAVTYEPAGLGTRFVAWIVDSILQSVVAILVFILLAVFAAATAGVFHDVGEWIVEASDREPQRVVLYFLGLATLIWGLGGFLYFGLFEFLMRGQTPGKRAARIRVVSADGFALEGGGILLRNVFRVIDQLPPLWIVPVLSSRGQRFGDMAAGTIVVFDRDEKLSNVREHLAERRPAESRFHFGSLERLRPEDVTAVARTLERWNDLDPDRREEIGGQIAGAMAVRLQMEEPPESERRVFLEELLAAEYRRQSRRLG